MHELAFLHMSEKNVGLNGLRPKKSNVLLGLGTRGCLLARQHLNSLQLHIQIKSIKSLLLSHHHSTCALVSEIIESVLQTVQKKITYRQYILTELSRKTMCRIHKHILSTHSVLFKTYLQLSINVMQRMYTFYIMYTYIHTIVCEKKLLQILHRSDTQCHGYALHGIQW